MQYKLTEEQSISFFNNMMLIDEYVKETSQYAVTKSKEWYNLYSKNIKWYSLTRNYNSFLKAIGSLDGLQIDHSSTLGIDYITHYKHSGWCGGIKTKKLAKMLGVCTVEIENEVNNVWKAIQFMWSYSSTIYQNSIILYDIKTYGKIPYTIDTKTLNHLKLCEKIVKEFKLE